MSITNTKAKSVYNANGTMTEWNLGFTYNDTVSNVHIYIVDANDNETEITRNYSIADGVLTYPTTDSGLEPLAEGNKLIIVRDTPRTQDIELTSNGKLDGKVLEGGYDKLTLQVQELTEQVNRAIKFPVTEDSADNFLDPITAITEAKKEALVEIAQATTPAETAKDTAVAKAQVATEQATIATNAATSAKAAQVGAEQAEQNATAQAEKAENAVTAFVEGLGTAKNAVIDLGIFDGKTSVTSSRIIEFSNTPIAVSLRFSDTNKKLWINGTNSTVGIEVIDNTHCNLFYSIASADFVGQNAVKGPFVVQAIIQYSLLANSATETEEGAVQLATKAEAEAGTNDTKAMTPLKTKYAIEANATVQTLRNDIDDLGDQVAGIEAKIPADASDTNQLATKSELAGYLPLASKAVANGVASLDANAKVPSEQISVATTSTLGGVKPDGNTITVTEDGIISAITGDLPSDIYTQRNLLAGKGIEIVDEPVEGGIDEHTLACWHFDEDFKDVVSNIILPNGTLTAEHKFGTHSYSFGFPFSTETVVTLNREKDFTIDFFIQLTNASTNLAWDGYFQGYSAQSLIAVQQDKLYMATTNGSTPSINLPNPLQLNTWNHIAFVYSFKNKIISAFVNGNKIGQLATAYPVADFNLNNLNGITPWYIDELRISDIARPLTTDGKFPVPTKPYSLAIPTGNKVVNNTITKTSQLTNDSGFITSVPVATTTIVGGVKPDGTTINITEDGTISATGGSGSGFDFEGTKAEFDAAVAAGTITEDSVSLITDDVSGDNIATKAELQAVDRSKADTALSNVLENIDYVVERQVNADGSWWRRYKSGWLEQGGKSAAVAPGGNTIVTFSKAFASTTYTVLAQVCGNYTPQAEANAPITAQTETGFTIYNGSFATSTFNWRAEGQGA